MGVIFTTLKDLLNWGRKNSLWPFIQPMGCCGIEILNIGNPVFDTDRYGIVPRDSPRQCDVMVISGWITWKLLPRIQRVWEQMPEPKYVIAMGECAISGGPQWDSYNIVDNIGDYFPIDVYVPGCPPRPDALFEGYLKLQEKIAKEGELNGLPRKGKHARRLEE
jgi:NADH-quinone oxidoreductase subunit B